jgi:hypothetical protein
MLFGTSCATAPGFIALLPSRKNKNRNHPAKRQNFVNSLEAFFSLNRGYFESKEKIISLRSPTSGEKMSAPPPRMAVQRKMKKRGSARGNVD